MCFVWYVQKIMNVTDFWMMNNSSENFQSQSAHPYNLSGSSGKPMSTTWLFASRHSKHSCSTSYFWEAPEYIFEGKISFSEGFEVQNGILRFLKNLIFSPQKSSFWDLKFQKMHPGLTSIGNLQKINQIGWNFEPALFNMFSKNW